MWKLEIITNKFEFPPFSYTTTISKVLMSLLPKYEKCKNKQKSVFLQGIFRTTILYNTCEKLKRDYHKTPTPPIKSH